METPQFKARTCHCHLFCRLQAVMTAKQEIDQEAGFVQDMDCCDRHLWCAPKKIFAKKRFSSARDSQTKDIGTQTTISSSSHGIRKLDFKSSPMMNQIMLSHARLSQESIETPIRRSKLRRDILECESTDCAGQSEELFGSPFQKIKMNLEGEGNHSVGQGGYGQQQQIKKRLKFNSTKNFCSTLLLSSDSSLTQHEFKFMDNDCDSDSEIIKNDIQFMGKGFDGSNNEPTEIISSISSFSQQDLDLINQEIDERLMEIKNFFKN